VEQDLTTVILVLDVVVDVAIAAGMLLLLREHGSIFGQSVLALLLLECELTLLTLHRTSGMIRRLTILVVNTGLLTAVLSIIILVVVSLAPTLNKKEPDSAQAQSFGSQDLWYAIAQYPTSSLYVSGFLANLNARKFIRGEGGVSRLADVEHIPLSSRTSGNTAPHMKPVEHVSLGGSTARGSQDTDVRGLFLLPAENAHGLMQREERWGRLETSSNGLKYGGIEKRERV
jgi:hypothetical protein